IIGWYAYQFFQPNSDASRTTIPYSTFLTLVQQDNVSTAVITDSKVEGDLKQAILWNKDDEVLVTPSASDAGKASSVTKIVTTIPPIVRSDNESLLTLLGQHNVMIKGKSDSGSIWTGLLFSVLPFLLFLGLIVFMGRSMTRGQQNVFGFGRSRARQHDP